MLYNSCKKGKIFGRIGVLSMEYSEKVNLAIEFAAKAHDQQYRKGTKIPYITHPFMVGSLLQQTSCREEVMIAGYLHDTLEDTEVTELEIALLFGKDVLALVKGVSEPDKTLSWEKRKQQTITFLSKEASLEMCMIACADKFHNIKSIEIDFAIEKEAVWARFKRGKVQQGWYYRELVKVFKQRIPDFPLTALFVSAVDGVFAGEA